MAKKKAKKATKTRKAVKKTAKAKKAAKKTVRKAAPKKAVKAKKKPAPKRKKKQIVGEGDYAATRAFDKDQAGFVKKNKAEIPAMGQAAEKALEGPEGELLRAAEATAAARSRDTF
jgi:hypothetical protein